MLPIDAEVMQDLQVGLVSVLQLNVWRRLTHFSG